MNVKSGIEPGERVPLPYQKNVSLAREILLFFFMKEYKTEFSTKKAKVTSLVTPIAKEMSVKMLLGVQIYFFFCFCF